MPRHTSLFESPKTRTVDLSAQEVFLSSNPDFEMNYQRRQKVLANVAILGSLIALPGLMKTAYYSSTDAANFFKSEGPYDTSELQEVKKEESTLIPAYAAEDALFLENDQGGLFDTRGYNVVVDVKVLREQLGPNEGAIITLEQTRVYADSPIASGVYVQAHHPDSPLSSQEFIDKVDSLTPDSDSRIGDGDIRYFLPDADDGRLWQSITKDGISLRLNQPVVLSYQKISYDGKDIAVVSETKSEVIFAENNGCENGAFISETQLTALQHKTVCEMFNTYKNIMGDNFSVVLDAVSKDSDTRDSVFYANQTIRLTYPYIGKQGISAEDFKRVALHEAMHVAFSRVEDDYDVGFMLQADFAYRTLSNMTTYKMPDLSEINTFDKTAGEVEKVWGILTESQYVEHDSRDGHPWDTTSEMISSTAAVLAYYPDEFIDKYNELSIPQQAAVRNVALTTRDLIQKFEPDVTAIIPEWNRLAKELNF